MGSEWSYFVLDANDAFNKILPLEAFQALVYLYFDGNDLGGEIWQQK